MVSSVPDFPAAEYDLNIHDGEVTTAFRLRDSGIRLVGDGIDWRIGGDARRATLSDTRAIRLTTEVETARGPVGATSCQIRFRSGSAVTVYGGNSLSPDAADRRARYETFVAELHRRLGPDDRARISFVAGYGGARFYFLLVAAAVSAVFWVAATVATLLGFAPRPIRIAIALSIGAVLTVGLFRLLQLNAPHTYDPGNPIGSAMAGSIGNTLGQALGEIRRGMTSRERAHGGRARSGGDRDRRGRRRLASKGQPFRAGPRAVGFRCGPGANRPRSDRDLCRRNARRIAD